MIDDSELQKLAKPIIDLIAKSGGGVVVQITEKGTYIFFEELSTAKRRGRKNGANEKQSNGI